jgi:hypothetical protein
MLLTVELTGLGVGAGMLAGVCAATRSADVRLLGGALAVAGGLAAGNVAGGLLPWWSLERGWPSLFPATLAAVGGGVVAALVASRQGWRGGLAVRLLTAAGCAFWLAPAGPSWGPMGLTALMFAAASLNWEALRHNAGRRFELWVLLALLVPWGAAAAAVLIHAHSARFCDLAVLETATLAGVGLVAAMRRLEVTAILAGPAICVPALMLGGAAGTYSEVHLASFILIAIDPCALWSLSLPVARRGSVRAIRTAAVLAMLVPCAVAVMLAMRAESLDFGE